MEIKRPRGGPSAPASPPVLPPEESWVSATDDRRQPRRRSGDRGGLPVAHGPTGGAPAAAPGSGGTAPRHADEPLDLARPSAGSEGDARCRYRAETNP